MREAGRKLKEAREKLGLTYRDVSAASRRIAEQHGKPELAIPISRLADIENKGVLPSLYRLYTLCAIYKLDLAQVLKWYGLPLDELPSDAVSLALPSTHLMRFCPSLPAQANVPLDPEPPVDLTRTTYLNRLLRTWGPLPLSLLARHYPHKYRYGFIGTEDWSMHPLIPPGSVVLIDESRKRIVRSGWRSERERPIYFFETRQGFACGWAHLNGQQLILLPHPASGYSPRVFGFPGEIEVVGRVVGVAMRLDLPARRGTHA